MEFGFPIGIPLCGIKGLAIAQFRALKTLNGIYRGKNTFFVYEHIFQNINEHR